MDPSSGPVADDVARRQDQAGSSETEIKVVRQLCIDVHAAEDAPDPASLDGSTQLVW